MRVKVPAQGPEELDLNVRITAQYMLPCEMYNLVILSNTFAQCDLCESSLNGFSFFPYAELYVFLDLCAHLVRHMEDYS